MPLRRLPPRGSGPKGIYPNVDFYSGLVYRKLGIPRDLFTPVFAISRVAGWLGSLEGAARCKSNFPPLSDLYRHIHASLGPCGRAGECRGRLSCIYLFSDHGDYPRHHRAGSGEPGS
jgi:hypothetical protein